MTTERNPQTITGYGINSSKMRTDDQKLKQLIDTAPGTKSEILKWAKLKKLYGTENSLCKCETEWWLEASVNTLVDLYESFGEYSVRTISGILSMILTEKTLLPFAAVKNMYNDDEYVIVPKSYPWENQNIDSTYVNNAKDVNTTFNVILSMLTRQTADEISLGEHEVKIKGQLRKQPVMNIHKNVFALTFSDKENRVNAEMIIDTQTNLAVIISNLGEYVIDNSKDILEDLLKIGENGFLRWTSKCNTFSKNMTLENLQNRLARIPSDGASIFSEIKEATKDFDDGYEEMIMSKINKVLNKYKCDISFTAINDYSKAAKKMAEIFVSVIQPHIMDNRGEFVNDDV